MQLNFKQASQSEANEMRDRVYAAMETGNSGQARTLMGELQARDSVLADSIRMDVLHEYGISL